MKSFYIYKLIKEMITSHLNPFLEFLYEVAITVTFQAPIPIILAHLNTLKKKKVGNKRVQKDECMMEKNGEIIWCGHRTPL